MNKMDRQAIRTIWQQITVLWRHQTLMTSLKSIRKRRQQLRARDVKSLAAFCFCPLDEKVVNKSCFPSIFTVQIVFQPISRPDTHAEQLKIYF